MAQYALPPGAVRKRAVFGLMDRDGWTWATIKATFWFLLIIFLLGYVPDRAYYLTVSPTIDLGFNAISPINLCPAENKGLPCPAPAGAVIPWEESPENLSLPGGGRAGAGTFTSGENIYLIGGRTAAGTTASVLTSTVFEGNLTAWAEAPALPEPRSDAAYISLGGLPFVVGGKDASGAPTSTVFQGVVTNGVLTGWEAASVTLPEPLSDLSGTSTAAGLYVFGGLTAEGQPSAKTYQSALAAGGGAIKLQPWTELTQLPLPEARADANAISTGAAVYVTGGRGPNGPTSSVFYLAFNTHGLPKTDVDSGLPLAGAFPSNSRLVRHCLSRATTMHRSPARARSTSSAATTPMARSSTPTCSRCPARPTGRSLPGTSWRPRSCQRRVPRPPLRSSASTCS